ncbi:MAG TPA: hypothetical protein VKB38_07375 [Terracidiphilus sp.]|nr:hypothetical protein [Terracidiphilus sp.]
MRMTLALLAASSLAIAAASAQAPPQTPPQAAPPVRQARSLAEALQIAGSSSVHILYIHGIGATGSGDSLELQHSICRYAKKFMGQECDGGANQNPVRLGREYAQDGIFARDNASGSNGLNPRVAGERYMGHPIWASWDEWHASAPFVDHYEIRLRDGQNILVDELNWWPLVLAVKCKFMMPDETQLAGRLTGKADDYLDICSRQESGTSGVEVRSVDWIKAGGYTLAELDARPNRAVVLNRAGKVGLMDWRFSDAVLGVGPLADRYIIPGIQQLLVKCVPLLESHSTQFITVTHSLGSYLLFASLALEKRDPTMSADEAAAFKDHFRELLEHLDSAYLIANQIPLLEMSWLGNANTRFFAFDQWSDARRAFLNLGDGPITQPVGTVVAWSDPNDLLTWHLGADFQQWQTPPGSGIKVVNHRVKNATHWFWLFENPDAAHANYARNPEVVRALLKGDQP